MTIAAGFICTDGIVLAADTKEMSGSGSHTFVHKLEVIDSPLCSGALAGAGYSFPVNFITAKLKALFEDTKYSTPDEYEAALSSTMPMIYKSEQMRAYPKSEKDELQTSFLVTLRPKLGHTEPVLFVIDSSLVTRIHEGVKVIGWWSMQEMADEFGKLHLSVQQAKLAALYLIYETKKRTDYVGGKVHIYGISKDGWVISDRTWDQPNREELFNSLQSMHYFLVTNVADPKLSPAEFGMSLQFFTKTIKEIRSEFIRIEKKYQKWLEKLDRQTKDALFGKLAKSKPLISQTSESEP
jgi:hypothetical protein